ncbi:DsrE family protein [Thermodesulfobium sp. 4217-1]|uniref:DsrE family protein n=1 Tax=Thermodesulfobium sp. 4217-1 TaxID=3120013 RepID=UPI003221DE91
MNSVVIHIDTDDSVRLMKAFFSAKNLLGAYKDDGIQIVFIANGDGVKLFTKDRENSLKDEMLSLYNKGVKFMVSQNALRETHVGLDNVLEFVKIVPSGIVEMVSLSKAGYQYIKA